MLVPRSLFYMGVVRKKIYAVCGWLKPERVTTTVEVYDTCTNKWAMCKELKHGPHEHAGILSLV